MSRIDDEREAARQAERIMLQKRELEQRAKAKAEGDSAFSRLVQKQQGEAKQVQQDALGRSAVAALLEKEQAEEASEAGLLDAGAVAEQEQSRDGDARLRARTGMRAFGEKLKQASQRDGSRLASGRAADDAAQGHATADRASDRHVSEGRAEGRKGDARVQREALEQRKEGQAAPTGRGGPRAEKGDLKADPDRGGRGDQQQGGKDGKPSSELAAGFRFNPALMAPVPVAQAKETGGSDRLRRIASEIAQKIVERVRVGTNAAGKAEFQIDLRSNVLSGLSIKVSGSGGRIKAVFSGSDREVLRLLRDQAEALKSALTGRGLTLEELSIEEKA